MRRRIKSTANAATRPGPFSSPPRGQGAGCEGQWSGRYLDGRPRLMPTISERRSLLAFRESSKAGRHIECVPSANSTRSTNYSCRSADSLGDSYWKMRRGFRRRLPDMSEETLAGSSRQRLSELTNRLCSCFRISDSYPTVFGSISLRRGPAREAAAAVRRCLPLGACSGAGHSFRMARKIAMTGNR